MKRGFKAGVFLLVNTGVFASNFSGPYPQYGWDFPEEIPERPRKTLSEHFLEFPSRVRLGSPKHYNSRHLKAPEHFQNCLPPSTAGDASFFRSGSGEGLSEPVMEFPAVLGVFLIFSSHKRGFKREKIASQKVNLSLKSPLSKPPFKLNQGQFFNLLSTLLFEILTFLILKPLNHVTVIAENSWESMRGIISCNSILQEKQGNCKCNAN